MEWQQRCVLNCGGEVWHFILAGCDTHVVIEEGLGRKGRKQQSAAHLDVLLACWLVGWSVGQWVNGSMGRVGDCDYPSCSDSIAALARVDFY